MKNIILTKKDKDLLEEIIVKCGRIVNFEQVKQIFKKEYSLAETNNRVSLLSKLGWFIRIKKGLYVVVTDIGSLKSNDISDLTIAQALNTDSYISFENALAYHNMFDQMLSSVGAVTYQRARKYKFNDTEIKFYKIKKELYFGYKEVRSDIGLVNIAEKEKAILDILYFRSDVYHASLVWEKLKEYKRHFDFDLLKQYTKKFTLDIVRQIGFFLDELEVNTTDLMKLVKRKNSYSKMSKEAKQFNSKWRLYIDNSIID